MDELEAIQNRQLRARLESIGTAGEILRVSLGAESLTGAVQTLLLGLQEVLFFRCAVVWEVRDGNLHELGRVLDGEQVDADSTLSLEAGDNPVVQHLHRNRHALLEEATSLVDGGLTRAIAIPFEGRLGRTLPNDLLGIPASHILWIEGLDDDAPNPDTLDTLLAMASQAGVLLTGFRYRDDLERTYAALQDANQKLQKDIDRARRIQEGLLPRSLPQRPGLTVASRYQPASKVSGDYFDCFPIDPDKPDGTYCLVMADVSGHGISAAMVMAMFKILLRREARPGSTPREILSILNPILLEQMAGLHYVTVFLGLLDPESKELTWFSSGHCPQLIVRTTGEVLELAGDGLFLGMFDDLGGQERTVNLSTGDTLLLYTDGITEADGPNGELFEMDRFKDAVLDARTLPPGALLDSVLQALDAFAAGCPRNDDVTLFAVRA